MQVRLGLTIEMNETTTQAKTEFEPSQTFWGKTNADMCAFIQRMNQQFDEEFRHYMNIYENWCDEMLTDFADALSAVESISLAAFEPGWEIKLLRVAQDLYRTPRQIFLRAMPSHYGELKPLYDDFALQADAMGEDVLEFMIALEKHDLKDAGELFGDLTEGLKKLETSLTTRWRKIARLTRIIPIG